LTRALIGFTNPKLTKKYAVTNEIIDKLVENLEFIDIESATNLLFELG